MKEFDFFEKLYVAEITFRGQVLTLFGISLGITVAVASGFVTQVASFSYLKAQCGLTSVFSIISALTLIPMGCACYHLFRVHKPPKFNLLDDALLFQDYFKKLKAHCEEYENDDPTKSAMEKYAEWTEQDVMDRLVDAASSNRTCNYFRTYHLNRNHLWIAIAAAGTVICYILKTLGG